MAGLTAVEFSCAELSVRELNEALRQLPDGTAVRVTEPRGRHNLAVGLSARLDITIAGNAGYFTGGLCDGPDIAVDGFAGWSVGENLLWSSPDVSAQSALQMWMASPEHRANLLSPRWREVGVAAVHESAAPGVFKGLDVTIVTTDFGVRH